MGQSARMTPDIPSFKSGDRVRAKHRADFPQGTVMQVLDCGFVLVRWDGDVLETAPAHELMRADAPSNGS